MIPTICRRIGIAAISLLLTCSAYAQNRSAPASPPVLVSLTIEDPIIIGGNRTTATVEMSNVATGGGVYVDLVVDLPDKVGVPSSTLINGGSKNKTFGVITQTVLGDTVATLTASYDGVTLSKTLSLLPGGLTDMALDTPIYSGDTGSGQVWLSGEAAFDREVELLSFNPAVAAVPNSVKVLQGERYSDYFDIVAGAVVVDTVVIIRARLDVSIRHDHVTVRAANPGLTVIVLRNDGRAKAQAYVSVIYSDLSLEKRVTDNSGAAVFSSVVPGTALIVIRTGGRYKRTYGPFPVDIGGGPTEFVFHLPPLGGAD